MTIPRLSAAAVAAAVAFGPACRAEEPPLVTGVAIYDITLDPAKTAGVAAISGSMRASLEKVCDAYVSDALLDAEIVGPDGSRVPLEVVSRHRESADALEFEIRTTLADMEVDAARGTALQDSEGLIVERDEPQAGTLVLPGEIRFPVAMIRAAVAAARAGETFVQFNTFDGTGKGAEVWTVSVLISPAGTADEDESLFVDGLGFGDLAHWKMALSYFPPGSSGGGEQMPAFSTEMVVYENGFAQAAVYDLGQFAMRLELTEFRPVPPKPCP